MRSFGTELNRLALAVSLINDSTWNDLKKVLGDYFLQTVGVHYFQLLVDGVRVGGQPGLEGIWSSDERREMEPVFVDGNYFGMRSLAYHKGKYLWVVARDKGLLSQDQDLIDLWQDEMPLPRYQPPTDEPGRTCIVAPLVFDGKHFGAFVMLHKDYKEFTPLAKAGIITSSQALARIVRVWQSTKEQSHTLSAAFKEFTHYLAESRSPIEKPRVFLAFSSRAERDVMQSINNVLGGIAERVQTVSWTERADPGSITQDLIKQISTSDLGLCYMSEKVEDAGSSGELRYTDNANVLFEAGMFHALSAIEEHPSRGWIPIREHERFAGNPCFDIASERRVVVERHENGELNAEAFENSLRRMIASALGEG